MDFYKRFIELCAKNNVSASFVAEKAGLSRASAYGWKNGALPSDVNLQKIADYFGVTVDYLLGKEGTNKPTITEADIKVALFGGNDADADKKFEDVKRYIEFLNSKKD